MTNVLKRQPVIIVVVFLSKVLKKVLNSSHLIGFAMHLKMQLGNFANFEVREVGNVAACSFKYKSSSEVKEVKEQ